MVLLRTSYICTGTSSNTILDYNLVRFGVCMIKLRHERMLILRCILPPPPKKTLNYLQKKVNPPCSHHLKNLHLQENEKNITPCKSFNHPKIASTIMKKPQTPHLKNFQFLKKP